MKVCYITICNINYDYESAGKFRLLDCKSDFYFVEDENKLLDKIIKMTYQDSSEKSEEQHYIIFKTGDYFEIFKDNKRLPHKTDILFSHNELMYRVNHSDFIPDYLVYYKYFPRQELGFIIEKGEYTLK